MLGSNPSAVAGDRSMGLRHFEDLVLPLPSVTHALVSNALNPGGMGAGPHSNQVEFLFFKVDPL